MSDQIIDSRVPRPVMLCILDGWGLSKDQHANAVFLADTPNFERIWNNYPHTQLSASGTDVGLQSGVMGNSEVGHLNIGAGRIVYQDSLIIDQSINDDSFWQNETLLAAMHHARDHKTRLHLMGLISNGSVHSSETHYLALLQMAAREGLSGDQVLLHAFTDGRDTAPHGGEMFLSRVLREMAITGTGAIASVIGRYFAMDRDHRWGRTREAYECLTQGKGLVAPDALSAVRDAYARGETDEFIHATVICDAHGNPRPRIVHGDAVLFFNYRSDRGRQLTQLFLDAHFDDEIDATSFQALPEDERTRAKFQREMRPKVFYATMTRYSSDFACPIAFEPRPQSDGLGETVAKAGKIQLRMAETEKYPHVTFFFSGGNETPWTGEERILAPSPQVATYDLQPEMSAAELTDKAVAAIESQRFDLIVLNFANPDMVGHTGVLAAAIKAVEAADKGLGAIVDAIERVGGALLVIADHGNCEQMIDPVTGGPHTAHTTNPVPCVLVGNGLQSVHLRSGGRLADVSPTLLGLMKIAQPPAMTGIDLTRSAAQQVVAFDATIADVDAGGRWHGAIELLQPLNAIYTQLSSVGANSETVNSARREVASALDTARLNSGADIQSLPDHSALSCGELLGAAAQLETEVAGYFDEAALSDEANAEQWRQWAGDSRARVQNLAADGHG